MKLIGKVKNTVSSLKANTIINSPSLHPKDTYIYNGARAIITSTTMKNKLIKLLIFPLILLLSITLLSGCGSSKKKFAKKPCKAKYSRYSQKHDKYPVQSSIPNLKHVKNAVPKYEPKSRGGNPKTYVVRNKRYKVLDTALGYKQKGLASWYGTKFHGHKTSNGETYNMYKMTAAHKTLPIPTYAEVTNLDNGRKIIVRINDRGPFHQGRIIDLSYAGAYKLGMLGTGTARVKVVAINPKKWNSKKYRRQRLKEKQNFNELSTLAENNNNIETTNRSESLNMKRNLATDRYNLQMGAFSNKDNARNLINRIKNSIAETAFITEITGKNGKIYKVNIGPVKNENINSLKSMLKKSKLPSPIVKLIK